MDRYDLAVIGSGPCGYVAAIRAAQLGLKVSVFEKDEIGGVCLNRGCIPTKVLSASSRALYDIERSSEFGIDVKGYDIDFQKIHERKNRIVKKLTSGIEMLMRSRRIELVKEAAHIKDATHIVAGDMKIETKNILIATGSLPFEFPFMPFDGTHILSSSEMLELREIPKNIIIVGGGVMGCEFASIFNGFGSEITIVEMMEQLLPGEDEDLAKKIETVFKKTGIKVSTRTKVERIEKRKGAVDVVLSSGASLCGEKVLVCVGRSPNLKGLGIEDIGIERNKAWIRVDRNFRTNINNIFAAGDVKGGPLLAHVASREGICSVEAMCGKETGLDYNIVPNCVFTHPEIASVGLTEKVARDQGLDVRSRKFLFSSIGKAHVLGETEGFIKLVVENKRDTILGAQIIGPHATELIAEFSPCIQFGITSENLARVIHAHPTLSELIQEASRGMHDRAIHSL